MVTAVLPPPPDVVPAMAPATTSDRLPLGLIAGVAALAVAAIIAGVLLWQSSRGPSDDATLPQPAPSVAPAATPSTAPSGGASSGGASSGGATSGGAGSSPAATDPASVLETFKPAAPLVPATVTVTLIDGGDQVSGQKTLDGWCATNYTSEKDRVARRQWTLINGSGVDLGLSVEAVAYGTSDQAKAALAQFRQKSQACKAMTVTVPDGTSVQTVTEVTPTSQNGVEGVAVFATWQVTPTSASPFTLYTSAVAQQHGRYLTIVWANQTTPFSDAARTVISRFAAQQADQLSKVPG
jgi:hypothetical protein